MTLIVFCNYILIITIIMRNVVGLKKQQEKESIKYYLLRIHIR